MLHELVKKNRSCRRFRESTVVERETLEELIDMARMTASGSNRQPLKYYISCTAETNAMIFPCLAWAGHLKDWDGPVEGERPSAYIIVLGDRRISASVGCDHGIAAQTIMLGAAEKGLAGCMIGSIRRDGLREELGIDARYEVLMVLALGDPKECVVLEPVGEDGDTKYYRTPDGVHHVPKRALEDVLLN